MVYIYSAIAVAVALGIGLGARTWLHRKAEAVDDENVLKAWIEGGSCKLASIDSHAAAQGLEIDPARLRQALGRLQTAGKIKGSTRKKEGDGTVTERWVVLVRKKKKVT